MYVLNNYIKFERKIYQVAGVSLGRPLGIKSVIYFLVISAILAILYFAPVTGNIVSKFPVGVLILIPFGLAWLLSDVGTEDRSPLAFFRSFILHNIRKLKGATYYRGRKVPKLKKITFGSHTNYVQADYEDLTKKISEFNKNKKYALSNKEATISYVEKVKNISNENKTYTSDLAKDISNQYIEDEILVGKSKEREESHSILAKPSFQNAASSLHTIKDKATKPVGNEQFQEVLQAANNETLGNEDGISFVKKETEVNIASKEDSKVFKDVFDDFEELNANDVINLSSVRKEKENKKNEELKKMKERKTNLKKNKKLSPVIISLSAVIGIVSLFLVLTLTNSFDIRSIIPFMDNDAVIADDDKSMEEKHEENLIAGLRSASIQDYENAVEYFDNVNFGTLDQDDKEIVLLSYLFSNQAEHTLKLDPNFDEVVISYYHAKENLEPLRNLTRYSDDIEFEIAVYDGDYEKIIEMKDVVTLNDEAKTNIVDAYLELGKADDALAFAKEFNDSETDMLMEKINKIKEDRDKDDKK